jgi:hypothetical protein
MAKFGFFFFFFSLPLSIAAFATSQNWEKKHRSFNTYCHKDF